MNSYGGAAGPGPAYGYGTAPALRTDGVLTRRFFAYLIDIVAIFGLVLLFGLVIAVVGIVTFGAAWILYAVLVPATAILYSALTVGGPHGATVGMRFLGLRAVQAGTGGPVDWLVAGAHALLFYLGITTLLLLLIDIGIGLFRADRRLGHDLLVGVMLVRR